MKYKRSKIKERMRKQLQRLRKATQIMRYFPETYRVGSANQEGNGRDDDG